jgi:hypothetical protein
MEKNQLERIAELNKMRRRALESQDSAKYAALCDYLGQMPDEDEELYNLGQMDPRYLDTLIRLEDQYELRKDGYNPREKHRFSDTPRPFTSLPSSRMYVPSTKRGLRNEIKRLSKARGISPPKAMQNMARRDLYSTYFRLMETRSRQQAS